MKIWFISVSPVTEADYIRYGLQEFNSLEYDIGVINISKLIGVYREQNASIATKYGVMTISTYLQFWRVVKCIDKADIVICGGITNYLVHFLLSVKNKNVGIQFLGALPKPKYSNKDKQSRLLAWIRKLKGASFKRILIYLMDRVVYKLYPCAFIQNGGRKARLNYYGYSDKTVILESQSYDNYMLSLRAISTETVNEMKYAVWVDQCIPFHPDNAHLGLSKYADDYFKRLDLTLTKIENYLGYPVRIALHPKKADDETYISYFNGRDYSVGDTEDLIRNCSLYISHYSTAINLAVTFGKPVMLLNESILPKVGHLVIKGMEDAISIKALNPQDTIDSNFLDVNVTVYEEYYLDYINSIGDERVNNVEVLINYIQKNG